MSGTFSFTSGFDRHPELVDASGRPDTRARLRNIIRIWRERVRFRWDLARLARDCPELIDDIGLTMKQVEAEVAKPFWRR